MATAGLSFTNQLSGFSGVGEAPNPYTPVSTAAPTDNGLGSMMTLADQLSQPSSFAAPTLNKPASIAFSPSKKELFVNGLTFAADDAAKALESEQYLQGPGTGLPQGGDWVPLDAQAYQQYLGSIRNPSLGRLASKNFGIGVDNLQMLAGRGLQLAGAEDTGAGIVAAQQEDLRKTMPFQRQFTDIDSGRGAVEWFVANLAQQGPNMLESIATAAAGFAAGSAVGGPLGGFGGVLAGLTGKAAFKQSVLAAAKKQAAGEALNQTEAKLLREAAGIAGAVGASYAQNLATGASDIYGELREQGADANDTDARLTALAGSIPYALMETLPEYLLASRVLGGTGASTRALADIPTRTGKAGELLRRGTTGVAVGGTLEGGTEAGQESLLLGLSGQDLGSDESMGRLINAFAAGFGVGGPLGGAANLRGKGPANLLDPGKTTEPVEPTAPQLSPTAPTGTQGELFTADQMGGAFTGPQAPAATDQGGVDDYLAMAGSQRDFIQEQEESDRIRQGIVSGIPGTAPGQQGVLNLFTDGSLTAQELAARRAPAAAVPEFTPAATPVADPRQGALQFSGYPEQNTATQPFNPQIAQQLQALLAQQAQQQESARRQQEFEQAQAQAAQQRQAQLDQLQIQGQAQRQLDMIEPEMQARPAPVNLRRGLVGSQTGPLPQQMQLFTPAQAPAVSRSEMLRRGVGSLPVQDLQAQINAPVPRAQKQNILFTKEGQPSMAALKSVGKRGRATADEREAGTQIPPTGRVITPEQIQIARAGQLAREQQEREKTRKSVEKLKAKGKADAVQKPSPAQVLTRKGTGAGQKVGEEVPSKKQATGKGAEETPLKKDEAAQAAPVSQPVSPSVEAEPLSPSESWEDKKPEGAPAFEELDPQFRALWQRLVARGQDTMMEANAIAESEAEARAETSPRGAASTEPTRADLADTAIETAETTGSIAEFRDAMDTLVKHSFFLPDDTNNKAINEKVREFLRNGDFTESQLVALDDAFLANAPATLEATYKGGALKGQNKPWFNYARNRNLLSRLSSKIMNLPQEFKTELTKAVEKVTPVSLPASTTVVGQVALPRSTSRAVGSPEFTRFNNLVDDINGPAGIRRVPSLTQKISVYGQSYANIGEALKQLRDAIPASEKDKLVRGYKISEYFDEAGEPKFVKSGGSYKLTNRSLTAEQNRRIEAEQKEEAAALAAERAAQERLAAQEKRLWDLAGLGDFDDDPDGMYYRDDGTPVRPLGAGRVKLLTNAFVAKLRVKPTVTVVANVDALRQSNPALYQRAAAARKEGDFDQVRAMGYSFGNNIIIFSDFIRTEQQLKFVLAHETLGHFGFKGVMGRAEMEKLFNRLYDTDNGVRVNADIAMQVRGMSKMEAIEEYLADKAAVLDTSLVARIWTALKNALNKLGVKFGDDEARYFIGQARRYVNHGERSNVLTADGVQRRMMDMNQEYDYGMFARDDVGDSLVTRAAVAGAMNYQFGDKAGILGAAQSWKESLADLARGKKLNQKDLSSTITGILNNVSTLSNRARQSDGLEQIYRMLENQSRFANQLLSRYQDMTQFTHSPKLFGVGSGPTEQSKEEAGKLLANAALLRSRTLNDDIIKSFDSLITLNANGEIDQQQFDRVRKELEDAGFVSAKEFRDGFDVVYDYGDGRIETKRFQYDVDENSPEWKIYVETRQTINQAALDLLLANYQSAQDEATRTIEGLNRGRSINDRFLEDDLQLIRRTAELYKNMQYEGANVSGAALNPTAEGNKKAEDFLVSVGRAMFDDNALRDWLNGTGTAAQYAGKEFDDIRRGLPALKEKVKSDKASFQVQKVARNLFLFDLQSVNAEFYAKRSILGSYVPFVRRGDQQVRLVAYDDTGRVVRLDESQKALLPYFQFNSIAEADASAATLDELFGDRKWKMRDAMGNDVEVTLVAERSKTRQATAMTEVMNLNDFVYVLNQMDISITPQERERLITTLTTQNERARKNLNRAGNEGWDKDVIRSASEHLETTAHIAAKKLYRYRIADVLLQDENWRGSPAKLAALKAAVDNATTEGERAQAQRAYDKYAFQYRYMAGSSKVNEVEINGKRVKTLGRGEDYRLAANEIVQWYSETTNIMDSTEDVLSGELGSRLKMITVLAQLGGSVASAVMNLLSIVSNTIPYLSHYNPTRAFGGGYGVGNVLREMKSALGSVKNANMAESAWLKDMVANKQWGKYKLTEDEAKALLRMTEEGVLQAAQFNALVGSARGKVFSNNAQGAIKTWMAMFSYTEQLNRRATALAAYRLERTRAIAQGVSEEQASIDALEAARTAVTYSQGEYAMFNRPKAARGNLLQYIFMYKQYPIITIELLRNMPKAGQLMMLGFLFMLSGIKGLPFAEDIMDLLDTLMQTLGFKTASVEKAAGEFLDSVAPGMTPYLMRGFVDAWFGGTVSTRAGMGDLIPLTGFFRAGANPTQELTDFAGPVVGAIGGLAASAADVARYGAEAVGLKDDVTSINGILRDSPLAAVRAFADTYAYISTGAITNTRGQVVSNDVGLNTVLTRMLGFYPSIATQQNDIVRLSKYTAEYAKEIKASYTGAYVKARLADDNEAAQDIVEAVRQWNEDAKGTGLEISRFIQSANRAAREAARPTVLRYAKAAPKSVRQETLEMARIFGLDEELN